MLVEKISNPWMKFKITGKSAKEAFLYVIYAYNAFAFDKKGMLGKIVEKCPDVLEALTEESILGAFKQFRQNAVRRGELISTAEFNWVSQYVKSPNIRKEIEKIVYYYMLSASSHHDELRQAFEWTINEEEIKGIVKDVLENPNLGSKRKMQVAKEFGEPSERFEREYLRKLLWDRHYDKAEAFDTKRDEVVISVILENINSGYVNDAAQIAARFLPDRQDIADEIQRIKIAID